jgi:uncharacterized protein YkwD
MGIADDFDLPITAMDRRRHRRAVRALIDRERRERGLPALKHAPRLRISARAWALSLTRRSRFTHGDFARRVLRFPFVLASRRRWRVAENLAWGTGSASTPRSIVERWMASPAHRRTILGTWAYGAVWTEVDAPLPGRQRDGVTVVHHFGWRGR